MGQVWTWITGAIAHLLGALKIAAAGIVGKVLGTFGLTMVTFEALLPNLQSFVMGYVSGMPADGLNMLGALGIGKAMSMILSAITVRILWKVFIVPTSVANAIAGGA